MVETKSEGFHHIISKESETFKPESGRYHLYFAYGDPFGHRTFIARNLKGLQDHISFSIVHPTMQKTKPGVDDHVGYVFRKEDDPPLKSATGYGAISCKGCIPDTVNNCATIRELYELAGAPHQKFTIPVLWDKKNKTIVNNESAEIVRIFNSNFNELAKNPNLDLYPEAYRKKIDELTEWIQSDILLGVYKVGYAKIQQEYEEAFKILFEALDKVEDILKTNRFLCGRVFTEIDIKLFVTLIRFDEAYHVYYKCNKKKIVDYPNILNYLREIYQMPGVTETVNMDHIRAIYFSGGSGLNHYAIIPVGPDFESSLKEKHNRDLL